MEIDVGDYMFLKISLIRSVTQFGIKGKLAPRYVRPFKIIARISELAYRLNLPPQSIHIHHMSMLKKYTLDPSHVLPFIEIPLQEETCLMRSNQYRSKLEIS